MTKSKRRAVQHQRALTLAHGTEKAAWDALHQMRRGKAAHADHNAIEYDQLNSLPEQVRDAQLLRFMARVAAPCLGDLPTLKMG